MQDSPEMGRLRKSLTTETLWIWILTLLARKPSHAYVLRKEIRDEFGFLPGNVTCYKVLYFLSKGGYVKSRESGRKRIYFVTEKGRNELVKAKEYLKGIIKELR